MEKQEMEELRQLREENDQLKKQIDSLSQLIVKKGTENQESLLIALMGPRQGSAVGSPLFKFLQKILNEVQTLTPFISERKLKEDVENEAKYEVARKNILDCFHQDLRFELRQKLKNYSIIKVQGEPETHVFKFNGNGIQAEGSGRN